MDEERLVDTLVELADTLIDDFDVIDFLQLLVDRCVELLDVDAAGLLLADQHGQLQLIASSNEQVRLLELFQLQNDQGPCLDAFSTGAGVSHTDLTTAGGRWPQFATAATSAGFRSVDALPMRLRSEVIGALNLFRTRTGALDGTALRTARALVDVATIGLLQERSIHHREVLTQQLQTALNSRVVIEQAKGLIAERLRIDMDGAFAALRGYARSHNLKLSDVANAVIAGSTGTHDLLGTPAPATLPKR
jgi:transcriptional regulator with GAF, ATPase, and Fis domain